MKKEGRSERRVGWGWGEEEGGRGEGRGENSVVEIIIAGYKLCF